MTEWREGKGREGGPARVWGSDIEGESEKTKDRIKHVDECTMTDRSSQLREISRVSGGVVMKAFKSLKSRKQDRSGGFTSDTLKLALDCFFDLLAATFRAWFSYNYILKFVLAKSLLPLLELGKSESKLESYRAIASTSLIIRGLGKVILLVWGGTVHQDSTVLSACGCCWRCVATSTCWVVTMDFRRTFATLLFGELLNRIPPIAAVRLVLYLYCNQYSWACSRAGCKATNLAIKN